MPSWAESQSLANAHTHSMSNLTTMGEMAPSLTNDFIAEQIKIGSIESIGRAIHAVQDSAAGGYRDYRRYTGKFELKHFLQDLFPSKQSREAAIAKTRALFEECTCKK